MQVGAEQDLADWFLSADERGNPSTTTSAWTNGNRCTPLVHGADYFARLVACVQQAGEGDLVLFTDWRGDPDERLTDDGPTIVELFAAAEARGARVCGLVWRSHLDVLHFSARQNRALDRALEHAGGEVLLDQRVRRMGSHHQKLVVVRCPGRPEHDVAFVGGIDLCHTRRDDADHRGDPQSVHMSPRYGQRPPWHDIQMEVRGPAVADLETVFRERWHEPDHIDGGRLTNRVRDRFRHIRLDAAPLPAPQPPPEPSGEQHLQVLRTYPKIQPTYDFAPEGERSIARGYTKAVRRATRLVYVEDQFLWSRDVGRLLADALRRNPRLHLVAIVPRYADQANPLAEIPNRLGRILFLDACRRVDGDRVHVFDLENPESTPVYVHAKACVVDDVWATVGSDNVNRRSWTHDSELTAAVLDTRRDEREPRDPRADGTGARVFARDLRLRLAREHLDRADGDDADLLDPESFVAALDTSAAALDAWHGGGRRGERPRGRLRTHEPEPVGRLARLWAGPVYRWVHDPDGRPLRLRLRGRF